ncbi:MAG: efflux RND transporter permease subunit [Deltaproteobacteria bacterium]|nr:efflux RND transporter permease subunit [Deltaproteobacteria bacterium]
MRLSEVAIRRPVFTTMLALSLVVLGALGLSRLPIDLFPDISFPFVHITTVYPGAGPADVEKQISRPIEDAVAGINDVRKLLSWSRDSVSTVLVQFDMGANAERAVQEVRERVGLIRRNLPSGIEEPSIARFDPRATPVLVYTLTARVPVEQVRDIVEDRIKPALEQIDGVALVKIVGGRERELRVLLHQDKLDALYLPVGAVFESLKRENVNIPSGHVRRGAVELGVRADAQFKNADEVRRVVVQRNPGQTPVLLGDVADVVDGFKEQRVLVRTNAQESVALEVVKQSGANTLALAETVKARMATLMPTLPGEIRTALIIDGSRIVDDNAREVAWAILFGGAMAILVILFFLLDVRGTLISALALPTAVIGTFAAMYAFGYSLNLMTLIGMSLAIGLLIDDSVVVREAITHRLERGVDPFTAARQGTAEVGLAVMATTFTICAVFLPVAFMGGIVGQFFEQFGITIAVAVLLSLFIALTLDPMLSARLSLARTGGERRWVAFRWLERGFAALDRSYLRSLEWSLRHKLVTIGIAAVALILAGWLALGLGTELLPAYDEGQFFVNIDFPPGTSLDEASRRSIAAERGIAQHPDVIAVNATVGYKDQVRKVHYRVRCRPKTERDKTLTDIKDDIRPFLDALPQAIYAIADPVILEGVGDYPPIMMQILGPDVAVLQRHAHFIAQRMRQIEGIRDLEVRDSPGLPEIALDIDRDRARDQGMAASDIALQSRLALHGELAGKMATDSADDVDVRVALAEDYRRDPERLKQLRIYSASGFVQLSDVASLREQTGPSEIDRDSRQRTISVVAYASGRPLGKISDDLEAAFGDVDWGAGYTLKFEGLQKEMGNTNRDIAIALVLALIFIYMVLASQFESFAHPFTIVISLPLAFVGALIGLWLYGAALSLAADIGIILLVGLSAKNGILLVDGALQRIREQKLDPEQAMRLAGPRRLRPILMTSAALILGMLPTLFQSGGGSEIRGPMAAAVVGGVLSNTLLTLIVVPVVFVYLERLGHLVKRLLVHIAPATAAAAAATEAAVSAAEATTERDRASER